MQKITQIQHHLQLSFKLSNGDQHQIHSSLSKQIYLLLQFQKKANNFVLNLSHPFFYKQRRPLQFSAPHSHWRANEKVGKKKKKAVGNHCSYFGCSLVLPYFLPNPLSDHFPFFFFFMFYAGKQLIMFLTFYTCLNKCLTS